MTNKQLRQIVQTIKEEIKEQIRNELKDEILQIAEHISKQQKEMKDDGPITY